MIGLFICQFQPQISVHNVSQQKRHYITYFGMHYYARISEKMYRIFKEIYGRGELNVTVNAKNILLNTVSE